MSSKKITIPTVTVQASERLRVVKVPASVTAEERVSCLAGLISTLQSVVHGQKEVVEIVYNLLVIGVPEIRVATPSFASITVEEVAPTRKEFMIWAGAEPGTPSEVQADLPTLPGAVSEVALAVTRKEAVYTALASLLYCIGKQASESARASVMDNRPDALIRRFSLEEEDQIILPGREAGPGRETLESIYNAFANYTEVRYAVISYFLGLRQAGHHLPIHLEILMTNFNLLRGAGMTHVEAIIKLVRMQPWVLAVPKLEPFFHKFTTDLARFEEVDEAVRPYHRLLVPQADYLFLSSELRPLIAVAGSFIEEVEKTFSGYVYNKAVYADLIDEVRGYVPGYQPTSQLSTLAKMLGVTEAPLPQKREKQKVESEPTV